MAAYLQPAEYAAFGIPDATLAQVETASRMVDAALGRPEGLLWMPDAAGNPCYMAGLTPIRSYTTTDPILPGVLVPVIIPGASFGPQQVGAVAILDRAGICGPVTIASAAGNTLVLESVQYAHAAGVTLEFGLVLAEQVRSRCDETFRVSRPPLARLLSIYGKQNNRYSWNGLTNYGQLNAWGGFPLAQTDYDPTTGNILLLAGDVNSNFTTVRIQYVAGWSVDTLPAGIKQAVAALVASQNALLAEGFSANVKVLKSGDGTIERFAGIGGGASLFDSTIMSLIAPYRIYRL